MNNDYLDLDLVERDDKKKKKDKKDKNNKASLSGSGEVNLRTSKVYKEERVHRDTTESSTGNGQRLKRGQKVQIVSIVILAICLIAKVLVDISDISDDTDSDLVDLQLESQGDIATRVITVNIRDTEFEYNTADFNIGTGIGYIKYNESDTVAVKFNSIDIDNGAEGLDNMLKVLQDQMYNYQGVVVLDNDYVVMGDEKCVYQMKYYTPDGIVFNTYWWKTDENVSNLYNLSVVMQYSGEPSETADIYDECVGELIETIRFTGGNVNVD